MATNEFHGPGKLAETDDHPDDPRLAPDPGGLLAAVACLLIVVALVGAALTAVV